MVKPPIETNPARMEPLALVLALSANSRPGAPNCIILPLEFRRTMATRPPRRLLTRSARDFGYFWGWLRRRDVRTSSSSGKPGPSRWRPGDSDHAPRGRSRRQISDICLFTNPDHGQGAFASSWRAGSGQGEIGAFVPLFSYDPMYTSRRSPFG